MTSLVNTTASTTTLPAFTEGTVYLRLQELDEKEIKQRNSCPFRVMTYASPSDTKSLLHDSKGLSAALTIRETIESYLKQGTDLLIEAIQKHWTKPSRTLGIPSGGNQYGVRYTRSCEPTMTQRKRAKAHFASISSQRTRRRSL